jgi:predicted Zn-dependent peptidase
VLKTSIILRKEMDRIKNNVTLKKSLEDLNKRPGKFVDNCALYVAWNQPIQTYSEYFEQLLQVTPRDILNMAKRIFRPKHKLVVIGAGFKVN